MIARVWSYLIDAVHSPGEQLTRGQAWLRKFWSISAYGYRQLSRHRAEGMAAELSYRTIFSLIPLLVLGLVTFRIVGGLDEVQTQVEEQLYDFFGVPEIPDDGYIAIDSDADGQTDMIVTDPNAGNADSAQDASSPAGSQTDRGGNDADADPDPPRSAAAIAIDALQQSVPADGPASDALDQKAEKIERIEDAAAAKGAIQQTLREVTAKVASIDFKSIGVVGLLVFIYAAIALADSVEQLFNRIFDAPTGRPIHIRLAIHWSIITLGSGLLAMSLYLSNQAVDWVGDSGLGSSGENIASHFLSILASWVLLFLVYALMPNTHVSVRAAMLGSLVASLLWEAAKFGFAIYVNNALPYSALYGSIGLIPLFLFWIYVTWLIILFGLVLTQALQEYHHSTPGDERHDELLPKGDPNWMLPIMAEIAMSFGRGEAISYQTLGDRIGLSSRIVHDMTSRLMQDGLVRRVGVGAGDEEGLSLARPAESITVAQILSLAHAAKPDIAHPAWETLEDLQIAERKAAGEKTLADITE